MTGRVLVTRPEPGASETAARVRAAGFDPIVLPLTRIEPVKIDTLADPSTYTAVAVPSANAIRHAPQELLAVLAGKRCYAVGAATAKVAAGAGLAVVDAGAGDGARLAAIILEREAPGARILYLCGRVRTDSFTAGLEGTPIAVDSVETYDTRVVDYPPEMLRQTLQGNPVRAALVYSAAGAERLVVLSRNPDAAAALSSATAICISGRTSAALGESSFSKRIVAKEPNEKGMLEALAELR